jgi:hypothetical protein
MPRHIPEAPASGDLADPPAAGPATARGDEAAAPGQEETNPPGKQLAPAQPDALKKDPDWHARLRELYGG